MIGGVPVGEDDFVYEVMRRKADEIVSYVDHTLSSLRDRPHSAWASLYYSCASRLDHWLRHLPPYLVRPAARRVDHRLRLAADQLGYEGMLDDDFARERFGMPARMHGCGIRSRYEVAPAAFVACCVESMELALDEQRPLFAALRPLFGAGAFAVGGHRFARFLASSSDTALEFEVAWDALRAEVQAAQRAHIGPLDLPAQDAGRARGEDPRQLDRRYHPQASPPITITPGPVEQVVLDHDRVRGVVIGGYGEWSMDVEWLLEEAARTAARRDWSRMGLPGEQVAYGLIVASYRRRMGVIAVREMARHRYRQSQFAGLTCLQLDEVGRERQVQQQGRQRAEALAERSVEIAQAMVPLAGALARGGG